MIQSRKQNMEDLLCHICGNMFSHIDTLKSHLGSHSDSNLNCPNCKYSSPRKDALKRHSKKHNQTTCRQNLLSISKEQSTRTEKETRAKAKTRIETKAYQADLTNMKLHIPTISTKKQGHLPMDFIPTRHTTQEFKTILSTRSSYYSS